MGNDYCIYAGPYLKVIGKIKEDIETDLKCPVCGKGPVYTGDKFCGVHGKEFVSEDRSVKRNLIDRLLWARELNEDFFSPLDTRTNPIFLCPNKDRSFSLDENHLEVSPEKIKEDIEWLTARFKSSIELVAQFSDKVEILWGVIPYYN